jgi:hypothetical protein
MCSSQQRLQVPPRRARTDSESLAIYALRKFASLATSAARFTIAASNHGRLVKTIDQIWILLFEVYKTLNWRRIIEVYKTLNWRR